MPNSPLHDPEPKDWKHVTDMAWRPAWAIRSRHGCIAPFKAMLKEAWASLRASRGSGSTEKS